MRVGIIAIVIERTPISLSHFRRCGHRLLCGTVETMQWFAIVSILEIPLPGLVPEVGVPEVGIPVNSTLD